VALFPEVKAFVLDLLRVGLAPSRLRGVVCLVITSFLPRLSTERTRDSATSPTWRLAFFFVHIVDYCTIAFFRGDRLTFRFVLRAFHTSFHPLRTVHSEFFSLFSYAVSADAITPAFSSWPTPPTLRRRVAWR